MTKKYEKLPSITRGLLELSQFEILPPMAWMSSEGSAKPAHIPNLTSAFALAYCECPIFHVVAKFRENKTLVKSLPFTDVGKSCSSREFFTSEICLLMLFTKIK